MPQVMEANAPQTVFGKELLKLLRYKIRLKQHSYIIYTHEVQKLHIVAVTTKLPLLLLMTLYAPEIIIGVLAERQAAVAVFRFCCVFTDNGMYLIAFLFLYDRRGDMYPSAFKIYCRPPQTEYFRAAKSVKRS